MSKMQGYDTLRIMEDLRGRLVAERAASRAAKENAELMENKLKELEKQLKVEIKLRRKAEKKLKLLKTKLEELNIPYSIASGESSEQSSSSISSEMPSCISSIASNSSCLNNQLDQEPQPKSGTSYPRSGVAETYVDSEISLVHEFQSFTICEQMGSDAPAVEQQPAEVNRDGLGAVGLSMESNDGNQGNEDGLDDHVDNSMALVLVEESPIQTNSTVDHGVIEVNNDRVRQVLDTLKHIKANIQTTMDRRRLIRVG